MTLRRKMGLQIAAMIAGLSLAIGAALVGINAMRQDYGLALTGYQELRHIYQVGSRLATARALLGSSVPERARALMEVQAAGVELEIFRAAFPDATASAKNGVEKVSGTARIQDAVRDSIAQLGRPTEPGNRAVGQADERGVEIALQRVGDLASRIRGRIEESQSSAQTQRRSTLLELIGVSIVAVVGAILLGIWQYRGVVNPLAKLSQGVRRIAHGKFEERISFRGSDEIAVLAADFNHMAAELEELYRTLELKVAQKSRELVRSERLASVGHLAAGVAHEINNPLGIISGYAEFSLEQLSAMGARESELARSLSLICDEAFRCKQITSKLLSLVAGGQATKTPVDLADAARQVIDAVGGLPVHRGRIIEAHVEEGRGYTVIGNETEMKQVILNLLVNALEATQSPDGLVQIELSVVDSHVRLCVIDNGRGMTPETLNRVFEPFFTDKKGSQNPGTGLGLSISHAIVQSHGGRIFAESDGSGSGSRFTIELPLMAVGAVA